MTKRAMKLSIISLTLNHPAATTRHMWCGWVMGGWRSGEWSRIVEENGNRIVMEMGIGGTVVEMIVGKAALDRNMIQPLPRPCAKVNNNKNLPVQNYDDMPTPNMNRKRREKTEEIEAKIWCLREEETVALGRMENEYREQLNALQIDADGKEVKLMETWSNKQMKLRFMVEDDDGDGRRDRGKVRDHMAVAVVVVMVPEMVAASLEYQGEDDNILFPLDNPYKDQTKETLSPSKERKKNMDIPKFQGNNGEHSIDDTRNESKVKCYRFK
ncbi:hypothetical protein E3N88_04795 [Mikania micrantha]|uniref:Uncharacterized protein n=1 Tax=Mikania micrantha TaxID=192012 RepID=A0A5N6PWV0_9ASTR|nr:hypothetical protein E3N88_04795 [Mikania micrantha]